ncbi:hypothetical protein KP509_04G107100 [Ceratopteris richardii]|uniref:Chromatin assembly factor 1 subunit FAS1 n=1 Tax=Ceratopteris richardii TaxID=49495 RepID=A0A8T2V013_CERRI|nr:hypothetical protein KP509_04G107100 [Ceratopteris richardii]
MANLCAADPSAVFIPTSNVKRRSCKKRIREPNPCAGKSVESSLSNGPSTEIASKSAIKVPKRGLKRKCILPSGRLDAEHSLTLVKELQSEVSSLINFYHEDGKIDLTAVNVQNAGRRAEIALLVEESGLPFSSLVANILLQLKTSTESHDGSDLTPAALRSTVLSIGERISFGTPNPDADVLEDDSDTCLWCWEIRDVKLLPESFRDMVLSRRRKRRKIAERIAALSGVIAALSALNKDGQDSSILEKAGEALMKTESEEQIRAYVNNSKQRTSAKVAMHAERAKEKESLKEQYRILREAEKEKRRLEKEEEKEKRRAEKEEEKRRIQQEKEYERIKKEKERLEREASKQKSKEALKQEKELRRQQEEAEKEQRRKEKEEADLRQQSALKKQANLMDRFLQQNKKDLNEAIPVTEKTATVSETQNLSVSHSKVIHDMDCEMLHCEERTSEDLLSFHLMTWKKSARPFGMMSKRWGQRRLPKRMPMSELRLQGGATESQSELRAATVVGCKRSRSDNEDSELNGEKLYPEWDDSTAVDFTAYLESDLDSHKPLHIQNKRRKLLQFDKSHRPAYYGSYSRKSDAVRPRRPLGMDSNLEYEVDSDEEWEEEDPGESLSDCEKDEEDEKLDGDEDEDAGDGFLVPDGYLSESEGACVEESDTESDEEHSQDEPPAEVFSGCELQNDTSCSPQKPARQRKALEQLTDHALRCNRPYIICNFHQNGNSNVRNSDRLCLEALRMYPTTGIHVELIEDSEDKKIDDNENKKSKQRLKRSLPDSSLQEIVEVLLSATGGLKKLVDLLSKKIPTASRSQLKDKVKEIADFTDNHWQVKKEILEQLGISLPCQQVINSSEPVSKSPLQLKPITKFFSKRCLPPETAGLDDSSPIKGVLLWASMWCPLQSFFASSFQKCLYTVFWGRFFVCLICRLTPSASIC